MTADYFGENNNATNYGLVYSSKVISGLLGAGMGSVVVSNWGYGTAFMIAGTVGIVCAFITLLLRQPKLPVSQQPTVKDDYQDKHGRQEQEAASLALD
jgi:MFS family permease